MPSPRLLFVCLHGSAKSLVAREHFRRVAREAACDVAVASAGLDPDECVPPHVVHGLAEDGFDVSGHVPERLVHTMLNSADVVVSFGCDLKTGSPSAQMLRWDEIPAVSEDYAIARTAIVARLHKLLTDVVAPHARIRRE
jgi:protein-tyrosine-phosphatase